MAQRHESSEMKCYLEQIPENIGAKMDFVLKSHMIVLKGCEACEVAWAHFAESVRALRQHWGEAVGKHFAKHLQSRT